MGYGYFFYVYIEDLNFLPTKGQILGTFAIFRKYDIISENFDEKIVNSTLESYERKSDRKGIIFSLDLPIKKHFFISFLGRDYRSLKEHLEADPPDIHVLIEVRDEPFRNPLTGNIIPQSCFALIKIYLGKAYLWSDFTMDDDDDKIERDESELEEGDEKMQRLCYEFERVHKELITELSAYLNQKIKVDYDNGW